MKCKNCEQNYWFGDYALNYCKVDKEIITDESECRFMCLGIANGGKTPPGITVIYKGYILVQGGLSTDYVIFDEKCKKVCLHASCTKYLTKKEAEEHIDFFLKKRSENK